MRDHYEPGEPIKVIADIYPATISPMPEGVPPGAKIRIIIAEESVTVAWSEGKSSTGAIIGRVVLFMEPSQTETATFKGGTVGDYVVGKNSGCASCGAAGLKNWDPFDGANLIILNRRPGGNGPYNGVTRYTRD